MSDPTPRPELSADAPQKAPATPINDASATTEQLHLDRIKLKEQLAEAFSMISQLRSRETSLTAQITRAASLRDTAIAERERACNREQQLHVEVFVTIIMSIQLIRTGCSITSTVACS